MDPSKSHHTSVTTRAIRIPLHGNTASSHHPGSHHSRRRVVQGQRASQPERIDSDGGNLSSSSLGSDWTSSPVSPSQTSHPSRLVAQLTAASPPAHISTDLQASPPSTRQRKDKQRAGAELPPNTLPPLYSPSQSPLGPSMIADSAYKSVNLNSHYDPESKEPARLITYTKYAQGFTWNDELFLPSYLLGRHRYRGHGGGAGRRRWGGDDDEDDAMGEFEEEGERCPVTDIFVTDEEADAMMP